MDGALGLSRQKPKWLEMWRPNIIVPRRFVPDPEKTLESAAMRLQVKVLCGFALVASCVVLNVGREPARAQDKGDDQIKRGAYLVNEVARCGDCHTPRNAKGVLDDTKHLQGAPTWFTTTIKFKKWEVKVPDITASGFATKWDEAKMVTFLSTGGKADMPMPAYKLTVEDAKAVTAYLRSLPGTKK
jgi:mono/diheme cytochrome c family protein